MIKKERFFAVQRVLKFVALLALAMPLALASCSSSSDSDSDDEEEWGEDYDPEYMKVCEHVANAANRISDIWADCKSIAELSEFEDEILNIRYVEDVRFSNSTMFVDIKDYGTIMYCFFPEDDIDSKEFEAQAEMIRHYAATRADDPSHPLLNFETAILINQQYNDEGRPYCDEIMDITNDILLSCGIKSTRNNAPTIEFFQNEMFKYDIVFLITHGFWDDENKVHWLLTGEKASPEEEQKLRASDIYKYKNIPRDQVTLTSCHETHNGEYGQVIYLGVSEKFFEASQHEFKKFGKTIFFNSACQSLMGGSNNWKDNNKRDFGLAEALKEKGVGCYFGYDESNSYGKYAAMVFFGKMASGMSVRNAYESLPDDYLHNLESSYDRNFFEPFYPVTYTADLLPFYSEYNTQIASSRLTGPVLEEFQDVSTITQLSVQMHGKSPLYAEILMNYPRHTETDYYINFKYDKFRYGFEYGTTKDFSNAVKTESMAANTPNCTLSGNKVKFSQTLTNDELKPLTTYYYRAFFYDGYDYYYSDYDSFTTNSLPVDGNTQLPDVPGTDF